MAVSGARPVPGDIIVLIAESRYLVARVVSTPGPRTWWNYIGTYADLTHAIAAARAMTRAGHHTWKSIGEDVFEQLDEPDESGSDER
jgi:hypothetical protein